MFGFVGRNGAGKTTTMKAVIGLIKPDVPEFYSFMTPREYLRFCGQISGLTRGFGEAKWCLPRQRFR